MLRSICAMTLRPTLPSLRGHGALRSRLARRDDERLELLRRQVIEVREVAHEALLDELIDERLAEPLDVHGGARREVLEAPAQPRRARRVLAAPHDLLGVAAQLAPAHRARRRHHPGLGIARPKRQDRRDDLRDDVAALFEHDGVAFADVLARDVFRVVQRRHRDGRAGEQDRLELRVRRHRAGPADVDPDVPNLRVRLLRGELERGRPAGKLRRGAEPFAQRRGRPP